MNATGQNVTVAFVPGVTLAKWASRWRERFPDRVLELLPVQSEDQRSVLFDGRADLCFVRLPVDREDLSVIPLYEEDAVVVAHREHPIASFDAVTLHDIGGETHLPGRWQDAIELAAANVGVVVVPQSIARLYGRRDLIARAVTDADTTTIALAWVAENPSDAIEEFVGIVRGRTANSSRGAAAPTPPSPRIARRRRR